jgi:hypothetical protein
MALIEKTQEVQAYDFIIFQEGNITEAFNTKTTEGILKDSQFVYDFIIFQEGNNNSKILE